MLEHSQPRVSAYPAVSLSEGGIAKPKLLYLVTEDWYFVSHRLHLAEAARASGFEVVVATRIREHSEAILDAGIRVIPIEMRRGGMNPMADCRVLASLVRLYIRERPTIVHHVAMKPVVYGGMAAQIARVSGVVSALAGMGWLYASADKRARRLRPLAQRILGAQLSRGAVIVQNADDANLVRDLGVDAGRLHSIPGVGVDLERFRPIPEPEQKPTILFPGRLLWDKGLSEFVQAARVLRDWGVEARFVIAGKRDELNPSSLPAGEIEKWVAQGLVEYAGWVEDMTTQFAQANVVCLPSYREGLPLALVEAAAMGRAIVATDVPGCRDVVRNGENGLLVPARSPTELAFALKRLIQDGALRRRMGARGREIAELEFGEEQIVERTLKIYRGILGRSQEGTF